MSQHPLVRVSRVPKLPQKGQFLLAAVRSLPAPVRKALFYELAADEDLRPELEFAMGIPPVPKPRRAASYGLPDPVAYARDTANRTAEKIAAASYPLVLQASARLVAFSGWMANNYVKHSQMQVVGPRLLPPADKHPL